MHSVRQFFLYQDTTPTAHLTRVTWVNQNYPSASFFRFARRELYQLIPGCVRDALGKAMVLDHTFDIQVFKGNNFKLINQSPQFVSKVFSFSYERRNTVIMSSKEKSRSTAEN